MTEPEELIGLELQGRFRLAQYQGSGQFSEVYEAEILAMGRGVGRCAVKIFQLKPNALRDEVNEELQSLLSLKHPGLVAMQALGELEEEERRIYCVVELSNNTLRRQLARTRQMPENEVRNLARSLAEALEYLHIHRRVHGELRPGNVVQSVEVWKLSDYELPRIKGHLVRLEAGSDTLHYGAPEAVLGRPVPASDVWSLACVLHEALTSHHPFAHLAGTTPSELAYRSEQEGPNLDQGLSDDWRELFIACFRPEPAARWTERQILDWLDGKSPEAEAEAQEIAPAPDPEPVEMEIKPFKRPEKKKGTIELEPVPVPAPEPLPLPPRRAAPALVGGLVILSVLFVVVMGALLWKGPKPDPVPSVTPVTLYPMPFEAPTLNSTGRILKSEAGEAQGYAESLTGSEAIEMVLLPGGDFTMGVPELEPESEPHEGPPHTVTLSSFYVGRREITQEQWKAVASLPQEKTPLVLEPSESRGDQLPVDSVSYEDALEFCRRLSRLSGRTYRLPTEAEWEYACRAGTSSPFCFGPTISPEVAIYNPTQAYGEGPVLTEPRLSAAPVGETGASNMFGLFDMHGNVEEWCLDYYGPYSGKTEKDPRGPEKGTERVLRGGGWFSYAWNCRSAARAHARPDRGSNYTGLRVVSEVSQAEP